MQAKHFGAIANGGQSHVQSACALGKALERIGHRFTFFGTASQVKRASQLDVCAHQLGSVDPTLDLGAAVLENPNSFLGAMLCYMKRMSTLLCEEAPAALRQHRIEFLLADQEEPGAATAADLARIPYATFCSSLPLNEDLAVPPSFVGWEAKSDTLTRAKNFLVYRIRNLTVGGVNNIVNRYRKGAGLRPYRRPDDSFSKLAHFSQLVAEFDFSRKNLPHNFNYVGPFQRGALKAIPFPYDRLNGMPLVYASLGTSQGARTNILRRIAEACQDLPVQLVMSLGGLEVTDEHRALPGNPLIVQYAPQCELLDRSVVSIAHAGLNSTMEALGAGIPMIAVPTNSGDQAGVAARIRHFGVGKVIDPKNLSRAVMREAIVSLLGESHYRSAAKSIRDAVRRTEGASDAARIIESLA